MKGGKLASVVLLLVVAAVAAGAGTLKVEKRCTTSRAVAAGDNPFSKSIYRSSTGAQSTTTCDWRFTWR